METDVAGPATTDLVCHSGSNMESSPSIPPGDYDALYALAQQKSQQLGLIGPRLLERNVQHVNLVPGLRPYQVSAVSWMLEREAGDGPGGILADEMGLGKTVEVLALILNNRRVEVANIKHEEPLDMVEMAENEQVKQPILKDPEEGPSEPKKSRRNQCPACSSRSVCESIENVIWRHSPDKEKSTIQFVIDRHCGDQKSKRVKQGCTCTTSNRARLTAHYNASLAQYSCLSSLKPRSEAPREESVVLCVCGRTEPVTDSVLVQCLNCSKRQHSSCVHYDVRDPQRGKYYCPHCWASMELIPSRATLIITPSSISSQWVEEIQRHVSPSAQFKVLVYQGVQTQGYQQPRYLAAHDVIIATYETLRKELYFAEVKIGEERSRRTAATYMAPPSPLLAVEFWRLCLDEAQMVEGSATRAAEMARKFRAIHKWCVTGTPIQKSAQDLLGLFMFLDIPVDRCDVFNPDRLALLLAPIFWRTRKSQVEGQIRIPHQSEKTHWLNFSAIEEHFYGQQANTCVHDALVRFERFRNSREGDFSQVKLSSLDAHTFNSLLFPLLRLRQACVHPQMVRGQFMTVRPQTKTMTMEELLATLIKRAGVECEESQRLRVSAANGQAALHIIKEQWTEAAEKYRQVLRWAEEVKDSVKTDTLQRLHTLHNLAEVLRDAPAGRIPPTLRDSSLADEAEQLRKSYLGRALAEVEGARQALAPLTTKTSLLKSEQDSAENHLQEPWWTAAIEWAIQLSLEDKMMSEIKEKLSEEARNAKLPRPTSRFNDVKGMKFLLLSRLEEMAEQRDSVHRRMRSLELAAVERLAQEAADCHLRPLESRRRRDRCPLCVANDDIDDYESLLFRMAKKDQEDDFEEEDVSEEVPVALRKGTWADGEAERLLKLLSAFARKYQAPRPILDASQVQLRLLEAYRKEFRQLRVVWRRLNDQASAVDELDMATLRLRLRLPHELPQPKPPTKLLDKGDAKKETPIYLLERHDVDIQYYKLHSDLVSAENALKRHMGHALYLKNLQMAGFGKQGNENPDPCPVCRGQLGCKWSVLVCGHSFCMDCIRLLVDQCTGSRSLKCAICRDTTALAEIAYVDTKPENDETANRAKEPIQVKGSHSTKVHAIVKQLLLIKKEDPEAKCLVFSTWTDVLLIISRALDENGVVHCSLLASSSYGGHSQLNRFKRDPKVTALLIPVQSGGNGLNLTEATHVLLVEPILNPGSELQAVGRVHRIGQTKPTVVHRFLIKNTVEEKMATMLDRHRSALSARSVGSVKENPVTLADLQALLEH